MDVADIVHDLGEAWRTANVGHISLDQMKVTSPIERCRTAVLDGHVARCESLARMRELLGVAGSVAKDDADSNAATATDDCSAPPYPCCGSATRVIEADCAPHTVVPERIDSS